MNRFTLTCATREDCEVSAYNLLHECFPEFSERRCYRLTCVRCRRLSDGRWRASYETHALRQPAS